MIRLTKCFAILSTGALLLAACDQRSQDDILSQVEGMTSASEVEAALGPADKVTNMGTTQLWQYEASADDVCFAVAGDTILKFSCI
ncbi:MAG: hypothetical protein NXI13_12430 [Proteobacteria bacterium]|nr:hypothetical protein [Pseudomonadota bacterium]